MVFFPPIMPGAGKVRMGPFHESTSLAVEVEFHFSQVDKELPRLALVRSKGVSGGADWPIRQFGCDCHGPVARESR
jgi:hypothetical protein